MERQQTNFHSNKNQNTPNKGFTLHLEGTNGETYIGHLVISENKSSEKMVKQLQDPANMKAIIAAAELRPFKDKEDQDSTDVDAILASVAAAQAE
jgi:hypothetical protein